MIYKSKHCGVQSLHNFVSSGTREFRILLTSIFLKNVILQYLFECFRGKIADQFVTVLLIGYFQFANFVQIFLILRILTSISYNIGPWWRIHGITQPLRVLALSSCSFLLIWRIRTFVQGMVNISTSESNSFSYILYYFM